MRPVITETAIQRPRSEALEGILGHAFPVLDHGFIRVVDYQGNESSIVSAARVSYGKGTKTPSDDRSLLRYLMRYWHTTPFEMCSVTLHVKLPLFVARQWIRHRTAHVNEYSARYSILDREFYIPEAVHIAAQSTDNKQGRGDPLDLETAQRIQENMRHDCDVAYQRYLSHIEDDGMAREIARTTLPASIYTQWYWKIDLHNLLHFLRLRADSHAQFEIREYADTICDIVADWVPNVWDAFCDYRRDAVTLSGPEAEAIRGLLATLPDGVVSEALKGTGSDREVRETLAALGIRSDWG